MLDPTPLAWFPEPSVADPTPARKGESIVAWLGRSTAARAVAIRAMLNRNLACLSDEFQRSLVPRLGHEWASAYFELAVARSLQQLGATLIVEEPAVTGRRPDFLAQFPDGEVTVEAVSPAMDRDIAEEVKRSTPLIDEIEEAAPAGWSIVVLQLPTIGLGESRRWFRALVRRRLLAVSPPDADQRAIVLSEPTASGRLQLVLLPRPGEAGRIDVESGGAGWDDTEARIVSAFDRKKRQVRAAKTPVLLAVNATGLASTLADFNRALFGHSVEHFGIDLRSKGTSYRFDGALSRRPTSVTPSTYAGVLAFRSEGFRVDDPVLYLHPRLSDALPAALLTLGVRSAGRNPDGVRIQAASRTGLLDCLIVSA
jgi:hypothetical protein